MTYGAAGRSGNLRKYRARDVFRTPSTVFNQLHDEFRFTLDVCALPENTMLPRFLSPGDNALWQSWGLEVCWMNPPYSDLPRWMSKARLAANAGATVVCLVPVRSDLAWWHDVVMTGEIRFIRGRLTFGGMSGEAPFSSAVVVFRSTDCVAD